MDGEIDGAQAQGEERLDGAQAQGGGSQQQPQGNNQAQVGGGTPGGKATPEGSVAIDAPIVVNRHAIACVQ